MTAKDLLTRQLEQSLRIEDAKAEVPNPRGLPNRLVSRIISEGFCPMCLGRLGNAPSPMEVGYIAAPMKCVDCNYDSTAWIKQSTAKHDRAWDNREG